MDKEIIRVVIADDEPIVRMSIVSMLKGLDMQVVGEAGDGFDAVELCRIHKPDLALMDVKMPVFDGLAASETILDQNLAGAVVLLTAFDDKEIIEEATRIGVTGYLVKPVQQKRLLPTISVAIAQSQRLRASREETEEALQRLRDSKVIQQAQSILAEQYKITAVQAYQKLRQMSMDKRIPMASLAKALLEQHQKTDSVAYMKSYLMKKKGLSESGAFRRISEQARRMGCSTEVAAAYMKKHLEEIR